MSGSDRIDSHGHGSAIAARRILGAETVVLTLVAPLRRRQILAEVDGLPSSMRGGASVALIETFCDELQAGGCQLVVDDLQGSECELAAHPLIAAIGARSYAAWDVADADGHRAGLLCAFDSVPRSWSSQELLQLMELAQRCQPGPLRGAV